MYVYPSVLTDEMIDAIAECERFVKYIDIPLQHINDRLLKAMHRRVTRGETEALLERLRRRIPGVAIRTTFIVGFPDETEPEFSELLDFIRDFKFDAAGAFEYSLEPETPAGRMKRQVSEAVRAERHEQFMLAQQEVAFELAERRVGKSFDVLIDDVEDDQRGAIGRHAGQAPEVDSVCIVDADDVEPGSFVRVRCDETDDYDLLVRPTARRLATL
jgi:ribosomal protein S12 methylthiotransferase